MGSEAGQKNIHYHFSNLYGFNRVVQLLKGGKHCSLWIGRERFKQELDSQGKTQNCNYNETCPLISIKKLRQTQLSKLLYLAFQYMSELYEDLHVSLF